MVAVAAVAVLLTVSAGIVFLLADDRGSQDANERGRAYRRLALGAIAAVVIIVAVSILRYGLPMY